MKPIQEQNFYEIFDVPPTATRQQIEQAYELAKKTYGDNSLATYSLLSPEDRKEIMTKIRLAYETLSDEGRRRRYDQDVMGLPPRESPVRPTTGTEATAAPVQTAPSLETAAEKPDAALPDIESLTGAQLKEFRERRKIPLQEIANKTRINITYLEYLEKEQYRSLPPPVYLRSYMIQYARMLGLDPTRVADRVLHLVEQSKKPEPN